MQDIAEKKLENCEQQFYVKLIIYLLQACVQGVNPPIQRTSVATQTYHPWSYEAFVLGDPEKFRYFTGVTPGHFHALYELMGGDETCTRLKYYYDANTPVKPPKVRITMKTRLFMILMRMRRDLSLMDLEEIMGVSKSHCGVIFFYMGESLI